MDEVFGGGWGCGGFVSEMGEGIAGGVVEFNGGRSRRGVGNEERIGGADFGVAAAVKTGKTINTCDDAKTFGRRLRDFSLNLVVGKIPKPIVELFELILIERCELVI